MADISRLGYSCLIIAQQAHTPAQAPFPDKLLLRDCLYLLQGIDGRYVKFAFAPPPEQNPYLTDKGRAGEGTGFSLGSQGYVAPTGEEEEVVGIDIVVDEPRVSCTTTCSSHS